MSKQIGNAGQGARDMAFKSRLIILGCAMAVFLMGCVWMKNMATISALGLPTVIVLFIGFKVALTRLDKKTSQLRKRARQAERGAAGEVKVAAKMAELPEAFTAFHDLAFDGFNIDHVAVSTAGIFLIETKSHRGKITFDAGSLLLNGSTPEKDLINQTWSQTYSLQKYLREITEREFQIKPILCFTAAFVPLQQQIKGVDVVNAKFLNDLLNRQNVALSPKDVELVIQALHRRIEPDVTTTRASSLKIPAAKLSLSPFHLN